MLPPSPTITTAPRERTILYSATGPSAPKQVAAEHKRLEDLYLKTHKRRCPVDFLYSAWGPRDSSTFGLVAAFTADQVADVTFLRANVIATSTSADRTPAPVTFTAKLLPTPAATALPSSSRPPALPPTPQPRWAAAKGSRENRSSKVAQPATRSV